MYISHLLVEHARLSSCDMIMLFLGIPSFPVNASGQCDGMATDQLRVYLRFRHNLPSPALERSGGLKQSINRPGAFRDFPVDGSSTRLNSDEDPPSDADNDSDALPLVLGERPFKSLNIELYDKSWPCTEFLHINTRAGDRP